MADTINFNAYQKWLHKLKKDDPNDDAIIVTTHVSQYVPRDSFIPDGMSAFARNVKRIGDFILSLIALIIFSPLFLFCYIAIRREDGGSVIFKQERIGRFGRPFYIYKFRSMRLDAEKFGPQLSHTGGENDSRLTKTGRFIRRTIWMNYPNSTMFCVAIWHSSVHVRSESFISTRYLNTTSDILIFTKSVRA